MKSIVTTLTITIMFSFLAAQNKVYNSKGEAHKFKSEKISINFTGHTNDVRFPDAPKHEAGLVSLIPTAVDLAFKTTTKLIENHVKKFTAEYTKQQSNIYIDNQFAPDLEFARRVTLIN